MATAILGRLRSRPVGTTRVLSAVAGVVTVGVLPVFLVGGLGVQLQHDLGFGAALLGIATAGFFGVAAAASRGMGWFVERVGARGGMRLAALGSGLCLLALAPATNEVWLLAVLWASGLPNALGQPAANLLIAQGVPQNRRGTGFGVKQSAIPAATLLAGIAVPAIALTLGWRWVFVLAGVLALLAAAAVPRVPRAESSSAGGDRQPRPPSLVRPLLLLAIAGGLASAAANALGAFVTTTAVDIGFAPAAAGLVLSLGSLVGLAVRLLAGIAADRTEPDLVRVITVMLVGGALGYGCMAVPAPAVFLLGVTVAFGAGWAWPGLLNFAVATIAPARVASATSFTQTGIYLGGSLGPLLFGVLAQHAGTSWAWSAGGAAALVAAGLLLFVPRTRG